MAGGQRSGDTVPNSLTRDGSLSKVLRGGTLKAFKTFSKPMSHAVVGPLNKSGKRFGIFVANVLHSHTCTLNVALLFVVNRSVMS